jgi:hypothetical protein
MGLHQADLIPTQYNMVGINKTKVKLLVVLFARILGWGKFVETKETRQSMYVMSQCDHLYLSEEACLTLEILLKDFQRIGAATEDCGNASHDTEVVCNWPPWSSPLPKVTTIPRELLPPSYFDLPARAVKDRAEVLVDFTEETHAKMKLWVLDRYASTVLNTCKHQLLPMISGPELMLHVDPVTLYYYCIV